jgi:surface carbohydrate biosynthesis protein (TIGR04326 family)
MVYLWNGYVETESVRSVLRYAEVHGARLRRKYLAWIFDMGNRQIKGKRLIDHLAFENGLSYWWLTLFVEKSFYKSPISDAIRVLALEEINVEQKPGKLRLVSANRNLHKTVRHLCQGLGISYEWERRSAESRRPNFKNIYRALPQPIRALFSLAHYMVGRWPLRRLAHSDWFGGDKALFFCSYFIHLDQASCTSGRFRSYLWEGLPQMLHGRGFRINWIHHYYKSSVVPNTGVAVDWVQRINHNSQEEGFHTFLDVFLSLRVAWRTLKKWLWLNRVHWRLRRLEEAFQPQGSLVSLWPLMRSDWQDSMSGPVAINNLLWIELFDRALRDLPHQKKGFYLCENQSWERALIHAWRKHGHGQLVAVTHATVRFWDLRYFTDPRTFQASGSYPLPQPDLTALNGKAAVDAYLSMDYPMQAIAESEALRYGYLSNLDVTSRSEHERDGTIKVLVLGDYNAATTIRLLKMLERSVQMSSDRFIYVVKLHPNYIVKAEDYPSLKLKVVTDSLENILKDYDVAYASNSTSAAMDAYIAGLPVVVMLDDTELNFSPLRGQPNVRFVSTPQELSEALQRASLDSARAPDRNAFFFLDSELPRWRRLLGLEPLQSA